MLSRMTTDTPTLRNSVVTTSLQNWHLFVETLLVTCQVKPRVLRHIQANWRIFFYLHELLLVSRRQLCCYRDKSPFLLSMSWWTSMFNRQFLANHFSSVSAAHALLMKPRSCCERRSWGVDGIIYAYRQYVRNTPYYSWSIWDTVSLTRGED